MHAGRIADAGQGSLPRGPDKQKLLTHASLNGSCRAHLFPMLRLPVSPCRWFLAQNPPALAKLEEELDAAGLLKSPSNPYPRPFTYGDIGKLHWLDRCIKASALSFQPVCHQQDVQVLVTKSTSKHALCVFMP